MSRPSDTLCAWLRDKADERGLKTAALATRTGISRARVRRVLTGKEPMLVDELLKLGEALELSAADLGIPDPAASEQQVVEDRGPKPKALAVVDEAEPLRLDPYANHHRQLLEVAFELGCDFAMTVHPEELVGHGIPKHVLDAHLGRLMLVQLDAAYHSYNNPRYDDGGITLTLSFDALYDCRFPWSAIHQVIFSPTPWEDDDEDLDDDGDDGPVLRLVT